MPNRTLPIVIAGAGPAGSSLAIRLAQRGHPVIVIEREKFPRAKLCGQFISPECFGHFDELGVLETMLSAGGDRIRGTRFFAPGGRSAHVPTAWFGRGEFALGLSRARMDAVLADRARQAGAEVIEQATVTSVVQQRGIVAGVCMRGPDGREREIAAKLIVDATGRQRAIGRLIERDSSHARRTKARFVAFKADHRNVDLAPGTCEIYGFRGGYAGLDHVEGGLANLCFIAESSLVRELRTPDDLVECALARNPRARDVMRRAERSGGWLAVPVNGFGYQHSPPVRGLVSIGDAAAFIDPFTGSGILMALEGSQALVESLDAGFENLAADLRARLSDRFGRRLFIARVLRAAAFVPWLAGPAVTLLSASGAAASRVAAWTRPAQRYSTDRP